MSDSPPPLIWFLRAGRKRRARGRVLEQEPTTGCTRLDVGHPYRSPVWVTSHEIAAGVKIEQPTLKLK